jgi:hypothetical protein
MSKVVRLGEVKEDNHIITPLQLLDMIREDIESGEVKIDSLHIIGVHTKEDGTDLLTTYRCRLTPDKEQSILANKLLLVQLKRLELVN